MKLEEARGAWSDFVLSKRIGIFFWEGFLGVAPSLINGVHVLSEHGYYVDVITRTNPQKYPLPPNFSKNVRILEGCPPSVRIYRWLLSLRSSMGTKANTGVTNKTEGRMRRLLRRLYRNVYLVLDHLHFVAFGLRHTLRHRYICFIGVDMHGLVVASILGVVKRVPFLYWSLEIRFLREFRDPTLWLLKNLEKFCNRRARYTIIQDWDRANSLIAENKIASSSIIIVPNGPLGYPNETRSDYFQQKFGLSPSCRIILHIGEIGPSLLSLELAEVAALWPDNWKLILHERVMRDSNNDPYLKQIQAVGQGCVLLSLTPVPYDELDKIVCSAHIGIALYRKELGPNFALIGMASGKLGHYLRCGLPVICSDLYSLSEVIQKYQCGVCVKDLREIPKAIETIFEDYHLYRLNALKCYKDVFEFGNHFKNVIHRIEHLCQRKKHKRLLRL